MAFDLPRECDVRIDVFDAGGRRIRTLVDGRQPAGRHGVAWDGGDGTGRPVAPGVYTVRMQAGAFRATQRMVRIR